MTPEFARRAKRPAAARAERSAASVCHGRLGDIRRPTTTEHASRCARRHRDRVHGARPEGLPPGPWTPVMVVEVPASRPEYGAWLAWDRRPRRVIAAMRRAGRRRADGSASENLARNRTVIRASGRKAELPSIPESTTASLQIALKRIGSSSEEPPPLGRSGLRSGCRKGAQVRLEGESGSRREKDTEGRRTDRHEDLDDLLQHEEPARRLRINCARSRPAACPRGRAFSAARRTPR
jgi:hypothetical protein